MRPALRSLKEWVRHIIYGMFIGASDLVPGISGGTMALILGIYENLIASLKTFGTSHLLSIFRLDFRKFHHYIAWDYLLSLIMGVTVSFILFSRPIHYALGHPVYRIYLYSLFLGMIFASIAFCWNKIIHWKHRLWVGIAIGTLIGFYVSGYNEPIINSNLFDVSIKLDNQVQNYNGDKLLGVTAADLSVMWGKGDIDGKTNVYSHEQKISGPASQFVSPGKSQWFNPWLILCGAIGISAMLLPGISGSYVLMMLGVYPMAIGALVDLVNGWTQFSWDLPALLLLSNLLVGIILGAVLFSRVIAWFLKKDHDLTMSVLIGLMIGAIHVVWPFWSYIWKFDPLRLTKGPQLHPFEPYFPSLISAEFWISSLVVLAGFFMVYLLDKWANHFILFEPEKLK